MPEFMELLKSAFSESANYLTWSFFSIVASFAFYQVKQKRKKKTKPIGVWEKGMYNFYVLIFSVVGAVNILYIVDVFKNTVGSLSAVFMGLFAVLVGVNAGMVVLGQADKRD
ncbi:membrane hypothetical protein [Xenorhabdus bovienii str. feltiae Moldova]|uniref:Phage protein n=2 Tax=Xenorhabdus bovienii TaxID=40576 RepID=A0A077NNF2_XENBV|nr:membrane hypothetical protein [Xenorhabdus bovienii str. feltiae Moldova]